MVDFSEILYDIYVSIEIDFEVDRSRKQESIDKFLTQLESLFVCFDIEWTKEKIKLYNGYKYDSRFPELESYNMNALLSFDRLNFFQLQILERTFHNLINFWNETLFRRNRKEAFLKISVYEAGKRP